MVKKRITRSQQQRMVGAALAEGHGDGTFAVAQKGTTPKSVMERAKELQEFRQWREGRAMAARTRA